MTSEIRSNKKKYLVGIYENSIDIYLSLSQLIPTKKILNYSSKPENIFNSELIGSIITKSYFMNNCEHYIIKNYSLESVSFIASALKLITTSKIKTLYIIDSTDISSLFALGTESEQKKVNDLIKNDRLIISEKFLAQAFLNSIKK